MYTRLGCSTCAQPCNQCAKRNVCDRSTAPDPVAPAPSVWRYLIIAAVAFALGKSA